jgi:putative transposase
MYPAYGTGNICRLFGKTRQGWYEQSQHKQEQALAAVIIVNIVKEFRLEMPRLGTLKLLHLLVPRMDEHLISIGRDKLYDLLGHHGLLLRYRRRKPYTTDSNHRYRKYHNLIQDMVLTRAGQSG